MSAFLGAKAAVGSCEAHVSQPDDVHAIVARPACVSRRDDVERHQITPAGFLEFAVIGGVDFSQDSQNQLYELRLENFTNYVHLPLRFA